MTLLSHIGCLVKQLYAWALPILHCTSIPHLLTPCIIPCDCSIPTAASSRKRPAATAATTTCSPLQPQIESATAVAAVSTGVQESLSCYGMYSSLGISDISSLIKTGADSASGVLTMKPYKPPSAVFGVCLSTTSSCRPFRSCLNWLMAGKIVSVAAQRLLFRQDISITG